MKSSVYIIILLPVLFSCSIVTKRGELTPEVTEAPTGAEAVAAKKPVAIKKTISDQDLKKLSEDKELKKRVVVLPFLDRKNKLDVATYPLAKTAICASNS